MPRRSQHEDLSICALFSVSAIGVSTGCAAVTTNVTDPAGTTSPSSGTDNAACPDVPDQIFATTCVAAGCHNSKDKQEGLDLQSPDVGPRLLGVIAMEGPGLLIDPSTPSDSVLYTKLTATPPFGVRMPSGGRPLDNADMACVLAWVTQQANNAAPPDAGAGGNDASAGGGGSEQ
jgi:hypothetical protein